MQECILIRCREIKIISIIESSDTHGPEEPLLLWERAERAGERASSIGSLHLCLILFIGDLFGLREWKNWDLVSSMIDMEIDHLCDTEGILTGMCRIDKYLLHLT